MAQGVIEDLLQKYQGLAGEEIHVGPWLVIDQERITRFAEVTGDLQWIHIDPDRAATDSPYGSTIAHGYLTLSLLPYLTESNHPDFFTRNYPGMRLRVNYGLNKVRFPSPVPVGSKIRARTTILGAEPVSGGVQITYQYTIERDGSEKPVCVAEFLARLFI